MKERALGKEGFSLIEVLIAMVILAVGILVVAKMQDAAVKGLTFSRHLGAATELAQQQLEVLRSLPFDDSTPTTPVELFDNQVGDTVPGAWIAHADNPVNDAGVGPVSGPAMKYYIRWRVLRGGPTGVPDPTCTSSPCKVGIPGPGQMLITVEVIWWDGKPPSSIDVETLSSGDLPNHGRRVRVVGLRQHEI